MGKLTRRVYNVGVEVFFLMMGLWLVVAVALGLRRPKGFGGAALPRRLRAGFGGAPRRRPGHAGGVPRGRPGVLRPGAQGARVPQVSLPRRRRGPHAVADLPAEPHVP